MELALTLTQYTLVAKTGKAAYCQENSHFQRASTTHFYLFYMLLKLFNPSLSLNYKVYKISYNTLQSTYQMILFVKSLIKLQI